MVPKTSLGRLGRPLGAHWGALGGLLGRSWDAIGRSWDALGAPLAALGAVLEGSWTLLGAPAPHLGDLGLILDPLRVDFHPSGGAISML